MRAWVMTPVGGPSGLEATTVVDPTPGPHDVVVATRAVSLNHRDLVRLNRGYTVGGEAPAGIPCSDAAGIVVAAGAQVTRTRIGDRVVSTFAPRWIAGPYCSSYARSSEGASDDGVLAEGWRSHEDGVVPIPPGLSFDEASTLPCAGLTAWHALFEEQPITAASTVLTMGTGGVSVFALQYAAWAGARVIASTSRRDRVERLRALGAHAVVHGGSPADLSDEVMRATGGEGVDHVVEVGGQGTLPWSLRIVRDGGTVSLIGALAPPAAVVLSPLFLRNIRLQGIAVGSRKMFTRLIGACERGLPAPVIDRTFGFDEAPRAFAHLEARRHVGKVVVRVGDTWPR